MILFLDSEFSGLGQLCPRLISLALVSEDGLHTYYAELPAESYIDKATTWVRENVLPHLNGGDCVMQPNELGQRLREWLEQWGEVRIAGDEAVEMDMDFLRVILDPWPANVDPAPVVFTSQAFGIQHQSRLVDCRESYYTRKTPRHHALHDARALRRVWLKAKKLDTFPYFLPLGEGGGE